MGTCKTTPSRDWLLDLEDERLWQGAEVIPLSPKAFAMLRHFVANPNRLITKETLLESVWPGLCVTESQVKQVVQQLRRALGDTPRKPKYIETIHRRGYRFIGKIPVRDKAPAVMESERLRKQDSAIQSLVGRDNELQELARWLEHALTGERRIGFITGEVGIGKSTLVTAFLQDVSRHHNVRVMMGQCFQYFGAQEPYMPIFEALEELCAEDDGAFTTELLKRVAPGWVQHMPWLRESPCAEELNRDNVSNNREGMLREIAQVLEELSRDRPLVLWLDDLHWADHSTLEMVAYLAQRRQRARLLVLGSFRPEAASRHDCPLSSIQFDLVNRQRCRVITLPLLNAEAVSEYIVARLPLLPADAVRQIHHHTEGHPLFLVHTLEHLAKQLGAIVLNGGGDNLELGVPDTLFELIGQGIEQLPPNKQRLLEACSVAGVHFCAATVAAALSENMTDIEEQCEQLVKAGSYLCHYGEEACHCADGATTAEYQFRHSLIREIIYQRLTPGRLRQLHRLVGERLELALGERAFEAPELALHFERGGVPLRALHYVEMAAEHALRCYASSEAVILLNRALDLLCVLPDLPQHERRELELHLALVYPLIAVSGYTTTELEQTLTRAAELCRSLGDSVKIIGPLRGLHSIYLHRGECRKARKLADDLITRALRAGSVTQLTDAQTLSGITHLLMGELDAAREELVPMPIEINSELLEPAVRNCSIDSRVYRLTQAAYVLWLQGYQEMALIKSDEAMVFAETLSNPFYLAAAVDFRKFLNILRGDLEEVGKLVESKAGMYAGRDLHFFAIGQNLHHGWVKMMQGNTIGGYQEIRRCLEEFAEKRTMTRLTNYLPVLAEVCWRRGLIDEGLAAVEEALILSKKTGQNLWEAENYRLKGELLRQVGDENTEQLAENCFHRAQYIAQRQGAASLELRTATSIARWVKAQGKKWHATEILEQVWHRFPEKGESRDLVEARTLLYQLHATPWHGGKMDNDETELRNK